MYAIETTAEVLNEASPEAVRQMIFAAIGDRDRYLDNLRPIVFMEGRKRLACLRPYTMAAHAVDEKPYFWLPEEERQKRLKRGPQ